MSDFNTMLRDQARTGLQAQLDAAVTNGDAEAARKITADLEKLAVATAPKPPPFNDADVKAELDKQPWFGTDPKKSAKLVEFGKTLDPRKFASAVLFAAALVKAVDDEFKPAARTPAEGETGEGDADEGETGEGDADEGETGEGGKQPPARKRTDAPGEGEANQRPIRRSSSGPWTKLSDAPADTQKEIKRSAERFVPASAPKEQRDKFIARALESHYATHQRTRKK